MKREFSSVSVYNNNGNTVRVTEINNELETLQNAANSTKIETLKVVEYFQNDKRKTGKKYFLQNSYTTISPVLSYTEMNHFILGMIRMMKILTEVTL